MAGQERYHLGNCNRFSCVLKKPEMLKPPRFYCSIATVLVGHKLYVFGGLGALTSSLVFVCDLNSQKWKRVEASDSKRMNQPGNKSARAYFVHNDKLFVFAGQGRKLLAYSLDLLSQNQWEKLHVGHIPNGAGAYHEKRGEVFLCNGQALYVFCAEDMRGRIEETKGNKPEYRNHHGCCMSPSNFFLLGGSRIVKSDLHTLSLSTMSWSTVRLTTAYTPFSTSRSEFSMSYINGRIFVMGGYPIAQNTNRLDVFEVTKQRWKCIHSAQYVGSEHKLKLQLAGDAFPGTRAHAAVVTRDRLLIVGGYGLALKGLNVMQLSPLRTLSSCA